MSTELKPINWALLPIGQCSKLRTELERNADERYGQLKKDAGYVPKTSAGGRLATWCDRRQF